MSDEDIRMVEDHLAWEAFRDERDQAVDLLHDAARRLEQVAELAIIGPWSTCGRMVYSGKDEDIAVASAGTGTTALWIATVSPSIAPFLAGWLRQVAQLAAVQERREDFKAYVDLKALGLAQHVMGAQQ